MNEDNYGTILVVTVIGILITALTIDVVQGYSEAKTYNRLTGQSVTTWEAMCTELRVLPCPCCAHKDPKP